MIEKGMGELSGEMATCYTLMEVVVILVFAEGQTHWAIPSTCVYSIDVNFTSKCSMLTHSSL